MIEKILYIKDYLTMGTALFFVAFLFLCSVSNIGEQETIEVAQSFESVDMVIYKPNHKITPQKQIQAPSKGKAKFITHCTITVYHPVKEQCNNDPEHTADNTKINFEKLKRGELKYCAISRDLLWKIPFKSTIYIEGQGYYHVCDLLNARYTHRIDIMKHPTDPERFKLDNIKVVLI